MLIRMWVCVSAGVVLGVSACGTEPSTGGNGAGGKSAAGAGGTAASGGKNLGGTGDSSAAGAGAQSASGGESGQAAGENGASAGEAGGGATGGSGGMMQHGGAGSEDAAGGGEATAAGSGGDGAGGDVSSTGKFSTLEALLANPSVEQAIARLPAGDGVGPGEYYDGDTPVDISGTWSTECCGGSEGLWPQGNAFAGTLTFDVTGPGTLDLGLYTSILDTEDGQGSFVAGTGDHVTAFLQLAVTCNQDGEHVRAVAVDRFIASALSLSGYVRSYVVLARDKPAGPWSCFADAVNAGSASTEAVFASDSGN